MNKKYIAAASAIIFSICTLIGTTTNTKANDISAGSALGNASVPAVMTVSTEESVLTDDEIKLIALVTMAEAEGECEEGKRLVIDVVLNRMDSVYFPDRVSDVIFQPNQFPSMTNGRAARCNIDNDICELVKEELKCRSNYDVIFFTAGGYSYYGYPLMKVGNHYFSSYEKTW